MLKRKVIKKAARTTAAEKPPQGRRFDAAQKQHALVLVASGMGRKQVAATIGTTTEIPTGGSAGPCRMKRAGLWGGR